MEYQLGRGETFQSLINKDTAVVGLAVFVPPTTTTTTRKVGWAYHKGVIAPDAILVEFQVSDDNSHWTTIDTYNTPGTDTFRQVDTGIGRWVRLNIQAITIGSGDPVNGYIYG